MSASTLGSAERALIDLARVALSDDRAGLRQVCRRFVRRPPTSAAVAGEFKAELAAILADAPQLEESPFRAASLAPDANLLENTEGVWVHYPKAERAPIYSADVAHAVSSLVAEHASPERLIPYGLTPSRTVLFTGPPGVGKTLTAAYVGSQLKLPVVTVNLASLISSLMGRTGQNLQEVFNQAAKQPCVLFLDEFDALAKSRDDDSDVGEAKRLANVVLQQLDQWPEGALLIAATNHPQFLDSAVHRRFDLVISFSAPGYDERLRFIQSNNVILRTGMSEGQAAMLALVSEGWSPADIQVWINRIVRQAVVQVDRLPADERGIDVPERLLDEAQKYARAWSAGSAMRRARLAKIAAREARWSQRRIADWLGVSHVTIGKDLNREIGSE